MNESSTTQAGPQRGRTNFHTLVLALVFFALGAAAGGLWIYHSSHGTRHGAAPAEGEGADASGRVLSESTLAVLRNLPGPVELRFYSLLDPTSTPASLSAFAGRVDQLLAKYQQAANGKLRVTRRAESSSTTANAAAADGIKAFNIEKGDACFLGVAVVVKDKKESLPHLSPDWEQALEPDLTRAIARVAEAAAPPQALAAAAPVDPTAIEEVKRAVPASVTIEEGTRVLQEAAYKDFKAAVSEMEAKVKQAEQRVTEAQNSGSAADKETALKNLQQVQADQKEKLQQIAAKLQAQLAALKQIKAGNP